MPSGKITVVGSPTLTSSPGSVTYYYRVARYLPNGAPDPNFSGDGFLDIDVDPSTSDGATAVAFDSLGRIVIGGRSAHGTVSNPFENSQFSVARLKAVSSQNVGFVGRVTNIAGIPIRNAFITLKNGSEIIGNTRTNPFGYFHLRNIQSGQTYTISIRAKNLIFDDRSVLVDDEITNYRIVGIQSPIL